MVVEIDTHAECIESETAPNLDEYDYMVFFVKPSWFYQAFQRLNYSDDFSSMKTFEEEYTWDDTNPMLWAAVQDKAILCYQYHNLFTGAESKMYYPQYFFGGKSNERTDGGNYE